MDTFIFGQFDKNVVGGSDIGTTRITFLSFSHHPNQPDFHSSVFFLSKKRDCCFGGQQVGLGFIIVVVVVVTIFLLFPTYVGELTLFVVLIIFVIFTSSFSIKIIQTSIEDSDSSIFSCGHSYNLSFFQQTDH